MQLRQGIRGMGLTPGESGGLPTVSLVEAVGYELAPVAKPWTNIEKLLLAGVLVATAGLALSVIRGQK